MFYFYLFNFFAFQLLNFKSIIAILLKISFFRFGESMKIIIDLNLLKNGSETTVENLRA